MQFKLLLTFFCVFCYDCFGIELSQQNCRALFNIIRESKSEQQLKSFIRRHRIQKKSLDLTNCLREDGINPFHDVADGCSTEMVRRMIEVVDEKTIKSTDTFRYTAIMVAAEHDNAEVLQLLLDAGIDATQLSSDDETSALIIAACKGNRKFVQKLLASNLPLDHINHQSSESKDSVNALMMAADYNHIGIVNDLINAGASLFLTDKHGRIALQRAIGLGRKESAMLITDYIVSKDWGVLAKGQIVQVVIFLQYYENEMPLVAEKLKRYLRENNVTYSLMARRP